MAVIYLKHPVHGHKVACSDIEANQDEDYGWERYTVDTPVVEEIDVEAAPANVLEVKTRRRKTIA